MNLVTKITILDGWRLICRVKWWLSLVFRDELEKNYQCFKSILSLWRHFATISFRLFKDFPGSAKEM